MIFNILHAIILFKIDLNENNMKLNNYKGGFPMLEVFTMALHHSNIIINLILIGAFLLNLVFAFIIIFMERRTANSIWAWLLVLVFLPLVGFILYLLLGRQIQREHIFKLDREDKVGLEMIVDEQLEALKKQDFSKGNHQIVKFKEMVQMLLYNNAAFLTTDNELTIYTCLLYTSPSPRDS